MAGAFGFLSDRPIRAFPEAAVPLPSDPDDPPFTPPTGADPLLWRLSRGLWLDHQPDSHGWCVCCRAWYPCRQRQVADAGLAIATADTPEHS